MSNDEVIYAQGRGSRTVIYLLLGLALVFYMMPLYVMLITSLKSLEEIRISNLLLPPKEFSFDAWYSAWGTSCIGVVCTGLKGYFINSIQMVIPAVLISTILGSLNGFVLTKWMISRNWFLFQSTKS